MSCTKCSVLTPGNYHQPHSDSAQGRLSLSAKRSRRASVSLSKHKAAAPASLQHLTHLRGNIVLQQSAARFIGRRLSSTSNGTTRLSARWVENTAKVEVDIPLPIAWDLWDDMEKIPLWMPWIRSVNVIEEEPKRKSQWLLSTNQFGRDWEFSWVATNLTPVKYQKIHWTASEGLVNTGAVRFFKRPEKNKCGVSLTISYEIPAALAPMGEALVPIVEGILQADMDRFAVYAEDYAKQFQKSKKK